MHTDGGNDFHGIARKVLTIFGIGICTIWCIILIMLLYQKGIFGLIGVFLDYDDSVDFLIKVTFLIAPLIGYLLLRYGLR